MVNLDVRTSQSTPPLFPQDLTLWLSKRALATMVLEAVQTLEHLPVGPTQFSGQASCSPRAMITLLAYCYATGINGSRDIELASRRDEMVRYLCANNYPDWNLIRVFRRQYRDTITQCLAEVLGQIWEIHCGLTAEVSDHSATSIRRAESAPESIARTEAVERIEEAIRADSMALDD